MSELPTVWNDIAGCYETPAAGIRRLEQRIKELEKRVAYYDTLFREAKTWIDKLPWIF